MTPMLFLVTPMLFLHCSAAMLRSPFSAVSAQSTSSPLMSASSASANVQPASFERVMVGHLDGNRRIEFAANVQQPAVQSNRPPLLLIPPVGVGIDRSFYNRLQSEWSALGTPAAMHAIDLLGTGSATPKPRRFYSPEVWAAQIEAYILEHIREPCVLVVQGGLLPAALEVWRRSGSRAIAGISLLSPPPLLFFADEEAAVPVTESAAKAPTRESALRRSRLSRVWRRRRPELPGSLPPEERETPPQAARRRASRRVQRMAWAVACSPVGNVFFRRLRGGQPTGARIRDFTQRNLFARPEDVDAEWMANCIAGSRDARGRFATFAYLCGSIPAGGAWRDDRGALFDSLTVPLSLLRGDYGGIDNARVRAEALLARAPQPSRSCSAIICGSRACVPYERAQPTAHLLAKFVEVHFGDAEVDTDSPGTSTADGSKGAAEGLPGGVLLLDKPVGTGGAPADHLDEV